MKLFFQHFIIQINQTSNEKKLNLMKHFKTIRNKKFQKSKIVIDVFDPS
jgi:hypothetical protein